MSELPGAQDLQREAQSLRALGVLGKSGPLTRLFDFLLARSGGPAPKEIEIAIEVFGKRPDFDVAQDSLVRVYVHKLRRRLDDHYDKHRGAGRLVIQKGEYRLTYAANAPGEREPAPAPTPQASETPRRVFIALASLILGAALAWVVLGRFGVSGAERELAAVRASPLWAPLLDDDAPIAIVVGDYYLLGETDAAGAIARLVREFHINSQADFLDHLELDPQHMSRYRNLDLTYLPTSTAFALHSIAPVLKSKPNVRVLLMSQLDGETIASSHIVYIGYLSGLGMLGDPVLDASRLQVGGTYDELIDRTTQRTYVARRAATSGDSATDYGYLAMLHGPNDHRILVIAGTRDLGVIETARATSEPASIAAIAREAGDAPTFESLMRVSGVDGTRMSAQRLFVAPISKRIDAAP